MLALGWAGVGDGQGEQPAGLASSGLVWLAQLRAGHRSDELHCRRLIAAVPSAADLQAVWRAPLPAYLRFHWSSPLLSLPIVFATRRGRPSFAAGSFAHFVHFPDRPRRATSCRRATIKQSRPCGCWVSCSTYARRPPAETVATHFVCVATSPYGLPRSNPQLSKGSFVPQRWRTSCPPTAFSSATGG